MYFLGQILAESAASRWLSPVIRMKMAAAHPRTHARAAD
jgi:hypothetical protein